MLQAVRVAWSALTAGVRTTAHGGTYPVCQKTEVCTLHLENETERERESGLQRGRIERGLKSSIAVRNLPHTMPKPA